jgi:hypothetical protein
MGNAGMVGGVSVRERVDGTPEASVTLVWLIDPKKRSVCVLSTVENSFLVSADQALNGGDMDLHRRRG